MKKSILVLLTFFYFISYAEILSLEYIPEQYEKLQEEIENLQNFPKINCESERKIKRWITKRRGKNFKRVQIEETIIDRKIFEAQLQAYNKSNIAISLISKDFADEIFNYLKDLNLPFRYPEDGCYARAQIMVQELEEMGLEAGKTFIEGNLIVITENSPKGFVQWRYHVAPVLIVSENGKNIPYVFDPSIFDRPVPAEEWYNIQTSSRGTYIREIYFTEKYNYVPSKKNKDYDDYNKMDNYATEYTIKNYLRIQEKRFPLSETNKKGPRK